MALNEGILHGFPPANGWRELSKVITATQDIVMPSDWEPWMGLDVTVVAAGTSGATSPNANPGDSNASGPGGSGIEDLIYGLVAGQRITCTIGTTSGATSSFGTYLTATSSAASGGSLQAIVAPPQPAGSGLSSTTDGVGISGMGGNGPFGLGLGGPSVGAGNVGKPGTGFGSGGSAGCGTLKAGGAFAPGAIILRWWSQAPWGGGREGIAATTSGQNME